MLASSIDLICTVIRLIKRLTPWPSQISQQTFADSMPQSCVQLKCERHLTSGKLLRAQLLSHVKNSPIAFHCIVPDHNFPCMSNNSENGNGSGRAAGGGGGVTEGDSGSRRHISPFTQKKFFLYACTYCEFYVYQGHLY